MAPTFSEPNLPSSSPLPTGEGAIDLRAYWRAMMRRRWVIVGTFVAVMLATSAYIMRQPRIYSATATLVIDTVAPKVLGNAQVQDVADSTQPAWVSKEYYETQYTVMKSRVVAERVAKTIVTARDDKFLNFDAVASEDARSAGLKRLTALRQQLLGTPDPAGVILGRLVVEPVKESRVVRLTVEDADPVLAAGLANAYARAYMEHNLAAKSATTEVASESLETQLPDLESKLQRSSTELSEFKNAHDIVSSGWEDKQNTVSVRVARINEELTNVRLKKAALKARYDGVVAVEKDLNANDAARIALIPPALADTINSLKKKVIDLQLECSEIEDRLLEKHPKYISCRQRLASAEKALKSEINDALVTARSEYNDIVGTEKYLLADLAEAKAAAQLANKYEPEYLKLRRAHEFNLKLYDVALRSLKETTLSGSTRLNNVSLLDAARAAAAPSKPNVRQLLLMGALIGLLLGLGLALGLEFLDNTVNGHEQVEQGLGLTFLGIVPSIDDSAVEARDLAVAEQPKSAVAECCRAIRVNLMFMSPERPLKSMLVTSAGPREGKTTTAANLAITMAKSGSRILLVDADMRRPRVHAAFRVPNGKGLSSLIVGEGTLADTVKSSGIENLSLLTCGPIPPNPADLLHSQNFGSLLREMVASYDRVIIDSPPVGAVSDAVVMSARVDGTVLILKSGSTTKDTAVRTVRALRDVKARIFGAVLNDVDLEDRQGGGYYYAKYYYRESESDEKKGSVA